MRKRALGGGPCCLGGPGHAYFWSFSSQGQAFSAPSEIAVDGGAFDAGGCLSPTLIDISRTGARVRGEHLPNVGEQAFFVADSVLAYGEIAWCEGDTCALEFDTPITAAEVQRLMSVGRFPEPKAA